MQMDLTVLKQFGLRRNDRKVYGALVALGISKSGTLMTKAGVGSSSLYASLDALVAKGLVSYEVRNNIRYYKPEEVDALVEESRASTRTLISLAEQIRTVIPTRPERNEINVFEGYHGFRRAFVEHVDRMHKREELRIIGFGSSAPERNALNNFLKEINSIAAAKDCRMHILLDETLHGKTGVVGIGKKATTHFLPSSYFGPTAYNISANEVLLSVWGKDPVAIRIRNPIIVASFIAHFDFLLRTSKLKRGA